MKDVKSIIENKTPLFTEWLSIYTIIVFVIISAIGVMKALSTKNQNGSTEYCIISVEEQKTITAEYLLAYILPLFAFDFTLWHEVVLFLVYFLTLGFLCIRHNLLSVNVVLELFHYRFYKCKLENNDKSDVIKYVISKESLIDHKGENITTRSLNNEYLLDLKAWNK